MISYAYDCRGQTIYHALTKYEAEIHLCGILASFGEELIVEVGFIEPVSFLVVNR